jgi:hypothetical protein
MVFCRLWHDYDQTKRTYHHHLYICGGDRDVLTWGAAAPQTMVEADAALSYGGMTKTKIISARGLRRIYGRNSKEGVMRKNKNSS